MEYVWNRYEIGMEWVWSVYGVCMYGIGMEQVWNLYTVWKRYGKGIESHAKGPEASRARERSKRPQDCLTTLQPV